MAWYEEQEITFEDARKSVKNSLKEEIPTWIVEQCLQDEYNQYNSFGSYRGFYSSVLPSILKVARRKNRALQTLRRATPLKVWMNHILYRPTNESQKSLRYEEVKANFNKNIIKKLI